MWDLLVNTAGSSILELSARAIIGSAVALFVLLILASLFKHSKVVRLYIFIMVIAIIFTASTLLFVTALAYMQDKGVIGAISL
jgi:uncharacterized membrane protein